MWLKTFGIVVVVASVIGFILYAATNSTDVSDWYLERSYDKNAPACEDKLITAAWYCNLVTNYDYATKLYRRVIEDHPECPRAAEAQYEAAMCIKRSNSDLKGAKAEFQKVVDFYPTTSFAAEARIHIRKIELAQ